MFSIEKSLERRLYDKVKEMRGWCIKIPAGIILGFPDRLILMPGGRVYFAEIKDTGLDPGKTQKPVIARLRRLGFTVFVIDSRELLDLILDIIKPST